MEEYTLTPEVNETQEFLEIANDFANPLELVREAISNSFDAEASKIEILFNVKEEYGEKILIIELIDNGLGMDEEGIKSFFDLGNSLRRNDENTIGEKGHGTKVFFNSKSIELITTNNEITINAIMNEPFKNLHDGKIPPVKIKILKTPDKKNGTRIIIKGYNNNRREIFTHERLKDYIHWFTKYGTIEHIFCNETNNMRLILKGLDRSESEELKYGHFFPDNSESIDKLFSNYLVKAPDFYCKRHIKEGHLKQHPEIQYKAIFCLEGNNVKRVYNPMIKRKGYQAPSGAYTVQERYGLWLCKDFIPIQRKNEWITSKGSEYTKFHAFINCQALKLTANRGSIDNTPSEILDDIRDIAQDIYKEIIESNVWSDIDWLESEAIGFKTVEKEKKDFQRRKERANRSNICEYKGHILIEPNRESGVLAILLNLMIINPKVFQFEIIDYDTYEGIDLIVKGDKERSISDSRLFYIELKHTLSNDNFNHSFENLHSIICWTTQIKHKDEITEINKETREMQVISPENKNDYTKYYLDLAKKPRKIEVIVLKQFLKEKLNLDFKPRSMFQFF